MQVYVNPRINDEIYLKDPIQSELGKKIICNSVEMLQSMGYEKFNFKKLGIAISSNEASIYRYFSNKQNLLVYLSAWYFESQNYAIRLKTKDIVDPREKLRKAIKTLVYISDEMGGQCFLELSKLQSIIIEQFYKIIRTKNITTHNESGYFESFKRLCNTISGFIKEIDPDFEYPITMATSVIEMSINNHYCCNNLPSLTEISCAGNQKEQIEKMMNYWCDRLLENCSDK